MSGIDIKPDAQGKVRDIYDLGDKLLMVATDRISAFDYILEDEIPHKGAVLTQISLFWLEQLKDVIGNHLISADVADLPEQFKPYADYLRGRCIHRTRGRDRKEHHKNAGIKRNKSKHSAVITDRQKESAADGHCGGKPVSNHKACKHAAEE